MDAVKPKPISAVSASSNTAATLNSIKVLRNTYWLLAMTLAASAVCAWASIVFQVGHGIGLLMLIGGFVTTFVIRATARTAKGLIAVFVFAGLMGGALGPVISQYLAAYINGGAIVAQALSTTAFVFLSLSFYAVTTKRNFNFLTGLLLTGTLVIFVAILANLFFQIPALSLAISSMVVLLMSGFILFDTHRIISGGESNYILATVALYLSLFNLFIHLLNLLASFNGRE